MKNIEVLILILIVGSITVGMFNVWIGFSVFLRGLSRTASLARGTEGARWQFQRDESTMSRESVHFL